MASRLRTLWRDKSKRWREKGKRGWVKAPKPGTRYRGRNGRTFVVGPGGRPRRPPAPPSAAAAQSALRRAIERQVGGRGWRIDVWPSKQSFSVRREIGEYISYGQLADAFEDWRDDEREYLGALPQDTSTHILITSISVPREQREDEDDTGVRDAGSGDNIEVAVDVAIDTLRRWEAEYDLKSRRPIFMIAIKFGSAIEQPPAEAFG